MVLIIRSAKFKFIRVYNADFLLWRYGSQNIHEAVDDPPVKLKRIGLIQQLSEPHTLLRSRNCDWLDVVINSDAGPIAPGREHGSRIL